MQKKCKKICVCQKNVVLLQPLFKNESWTESFGAPENFNFWGERSTIRSVLRGFCPKSREY